MGQNQEKFRSTCFQNINPERFICFGSNLEHITTAPAVGMVGLTGAFDLCFQQDVRNICYIGTEGILFLTPLLNAFLALAQSCQFWGEETIHYFFVVLYFHECGFVSFFQKSRVGVSLQSAECRLIKRSSRRGLQQQQPITYKEEPCLICEGGFY